MWTIAWMHETRPLAAWASIMRAPLWTSHMLNVRDTTSGGVDGGKAGNDPLAWAMQPTTSVFSPLRAAGTSCDMVSLLAMPGMDP